MEIKISVSWHIVVVDENRHEWDYGWDHENQREPFDMWHGSFDVEDQEQNHGC